VNRCVPRRCGALGNLAFNAENQVKIAAAGGIEVSPPCLPGARAVIPCALTRQHAHVRYN
jgi:hypothetical protein